MPVSIDDILLALEFISAGRSLGETHAYLCRQSGKIYCHSDYFEGDVVNDELPEDIEDGEKYVEIPDKLKLDLGKPLALDFTRQVLPDDFDEVRDMFRRRGAYAHFKDLLAKRRALEQWHSFEQKQTERALREWCELNAVELAD